MDLVDVILGAGDGATLAKMAERAGLDQDQARAVLGGVVPALAHGIERNTLSRGGLADIIAALGSGHHEDYLDRADLAGGDRARQDGNAILGHIVGSKHASRMIAARTARETGVAADKVEHMLPEIAAVTMGGLSRQTMAAFGDIFGKLPSGTAGGVRTDMPQQQPLPIPGEPFGSDGNAPFDGQGSPRLGSDKPNGDFADQSPLPVPGDAPGGNWGNSGGRRQRPGYKDLSDILRRRGGRVPGMGGGSLWGVVREIIASALGFRNGGVVSWIIRLVLFRLLWPLLKRMVLGR